MFSLLPSLSAACQAGGGAFTHVRRLLQPVPAPELPGLLLRGGGRGAGQRVSVRRRLLHGGLDGTSPHNLAFAELSPPRLMNVRVVIWVVYVLYTPHAFDGQTYSLWALKSCLSHTSYPGYLAGSYASYHLILESYPSCVAVYQQGVNLAIMCLKPARFKSYHTVMIVVIVDSLF